MDLRTFYFLGRNMAGWQDGILLKDLVMKDDTLLIGEDLTINDTINNLSYSEGIFLDTDVINGLLDEIENYVVVALREFKGKVKKNTTSSLVSLNNGADYVIALLTNTDSMKTVKIKITRVNNENVIDLLDTNVDMDVI